MCGSYPNLAAASELTFEYLQKLPENSFLPFFFLVQYYCFPSWQVKMLVSISGLAGLHTVFFFK